MTTWAVLLAAALFFAFKFLPVLFFNLMDTETIPLPLIYQDILVEHHPAGDWRWGGFSALFPDLTVFALLRTLLPQGWLALQGTMIFFFLAWLGGCVAVVRALGRPQAQVLVAFLFLLICRVATGPESHPLDLRDPFFQPIYHAGTGVLWLLTAALLFRQIQRGGAWLSALLVVLAFLGGISDFLFLVVFVAPALATLAVVAAAFPAAWRRYGALAAGIGAAGLAAYFLAGRIFPIPLTTSEPNALDLRDLPHEMQVLWAQAHTREDAVETVLMALGLLVVAGALAAAPMLAFRRGRPGNLPVIAGLTFAACSIASNWGAVVLANGYGYVYSNRYVVVALLTPILVTAFVVHGLVRLPRRLEYAVTAAAAVLMIVWGCSYQPPSDTYRQMVEDIPFLQGVMRDNGIAAGLADYWEGNISTVISGGALPLRAIDVSGDIYTFETLAWFGKGKPMAQGPHFRLIWCPNPNLSVRYGPPDRVYTTPGNTQVWVYSDAHGIRYNPYLNVMSNKWTDDGHTLPLDFNTDAETGRVEGNARTALEGRDEDGYVAHLIYMRLQPGRYRATCRFRYLTAPQPGREAVFRRYVRAELDGNQPAAATPLAGKPGEQTVTATFEVKRAGQGCELGVFYFGSGGLRVESLTLTSLQP